jgi:uncharacterized membrane protein
MAAQQGVKLFDEGEIRRWDAPPRIRFEARPRPRDGRDGALAAGLGWFSLGLGLVELSAPGLLARAIGVSDNPDNRELLRAAGMREIASGVGILTRPRQAGWVWSRVGGDVMDLALLGLGFRSSHADTGRLAIATAAVAGVTALDLVCGRRFSHAAAADPFEHITVATTVNRPPAEVYAFWRDLENLPRFMRHVESVTASGANRWLWRVKGPAGTSVEWEAEIAGERPNELLTWRSLPGAQVENSGSVHFRPAPGGRGTEVVVRLNFSPPAGAVGSLAAWLGGEHPQQQLREDLRRFKQVMETGEIARTEASEGILGMSRPAQPAPMAPYSEFAKGER